MTYFTCDIYVVLSDMQDICVTLSLVLPPPASVALGSCATFVPRHRKTSRLNLLVFGKTGDITTTGSTEQERLDGKQRCNLLSVVIATNCFCFYVRR